MTETGPDPRNDSPGQGQANGSRRLGRIVLFVSLAINLLILGAVAGALLGGGGPGGRHGPERDLRELGFGPFVEALPPDARGDLAKALRREAGSFRENREALRADFEAVLEALRSEPFDRARMQELMDRQRARVADRQALGQRLLMEQIEAMSADERRAYADALDSALRRRGRGRR